jgi:hypothetical protein
METTTTVKVPLKDSRTRHLPILQSRLFPPLPNPQTAYGVSRVWQVLEGFLANRFSQISVTGIASTHQKRQKRLKGQRTLESVSSMAS